jgi:hypothetical protein
MDIWQDMIDVTVTSSEGRSTTVDDGRQQRNDSNASDIGRDIKPIPDTKAHLHLASIPTPPVKHPGPHYKFDRLSSLLLNYD